MVQDLLVRVGFGTNRLQRVVLLILVLLIQALCSVLLLIVTNFHVHQAMLRGATLRGSAFFGLWLVHEERQALLGLSVELVGIDERDKIGAVLVWI